jgi:RimJ/RimL family protein N-acetyltransferase
MEGLPQGVEIRPIAEEHIAGFHAAVDNVARERRYLAMLQAPPLAETTQWARDNIEKGNPQFVALAGGRVVGWCDVFPEKRETMAHGGVLGVGVIDGFRGKGIGIALMRATLARAKQAGLTRVELTVREDNLRAKALYEKVGFAVEGVKRRAALFDGKHYDLILMSVLL